MDRTIEKFEGVASDIEMSSLSTLYSAVMENLTAYKDSPTSANLKNWEKATEALERYTGVLTARYFPSDRTFKNIPEMLAHLRSEGFKIAQSTAYKHAKEGLLKTTAANGEFTLSEVERYARENLVRKTAAKQKEMPDVERIREKKLLADAQKAEAQADHWDIKTKIQRGLLIEKERFDRELAARAAFLKSDLENFFLSNADQMVAIVAGNPEKAPDLAAWLVKHFQAHVGRYAEDREWTVNA